jgi:hypothetical protein
LVIYKCPVSLGPGQYFTLGIRNLISPERACRFHIGDPGFDDQAIPYEGRLQIYNLVRPHDPPGTKRIVLLRRPAIGCGMSDSSMLHPFHVMEISGVTQFIDVFFHDCVRIFKPCAHDGSLNDDKFSVTLISTPSNQHARGANSMPAVARAQPDQKLSIQFPISFLMMWVIDKTRSYGAICNQKALKNQIGAALCYRHPVQTSRQP